MIRTPYSKIAVDKYIKENLENSSLQDYREVDEKGVFSYFYDEINKKEIYGYPYSSDFVDKEGQTYTYREYDKLDDEKKKECRLRYFYLPNYHELYIGTTGSGKTTGCIEPQIRAIAGQKNKPNLFITDPKGELFDHHAVYLKKRGYRVFILNYKDISRSHSWNPLMEVYEKQQELLDLGKDYTVKTGQPKEGMELYDHKDKYKGSYYLYKGIAFANLESFEGYVQSEKYSLQSQVSSLVNQIATCIFPDTKALDPTWNNGARDFFKGILLCMLDDSIHPERGFTKKMMTLKTVNDIYAMECAGLPNDAPRDAKQKELMFIKDKPIVAVNLMSTVRVTAESTRKGFLSSFQSMIGPWMQGHIFQITAETNISVEDDEKPFAIFIATRDYDKSDNTIAGLFIDWVYRRTLQIAEKHVEQGLPIRDTHFLLDEFANIPRIPDFDNKIATARSRHIWFHIFVQAYDQLDLVYGEDVAKIICDNCNEHVFLGSQSHATKERFSNECGKKSVKDVSNLTNENADLMLREVPVVSITDLDAISPGEMYIKRIYQGVIKGGYVRSYQAADAGYYQDFRKTNPYAEVVPYNTIIPDDDDRTYFAAAPTWYKPKGKPARKVEEAPKRETKQTAPSGGGIDFSKVIKQGGKK